jgi:hypothetical protein
MKHHQKRNQHAEYRKVRSEYSKVSRQLSLLNKLLRLNKKQENSVRAQTAFNRDRFNLFAPTSAPSSVDRDETETHFQENYFDDTRDSTFSPPPGLPQPPRPTVAFADMFPSFEKFMELLKKKSSDSAAGPYGIQYKVYKLFPCAAKKLYLLCTRAHTERRTPSCWGHAFMVLLTKEGKPTNHAKHMRNIACSSTAGKMFWSCMSSMLSPFLLKNGYIDPTINKGALLGIPGCLEHSWALMEALQNAKRSKRQIVVTLTDIANAYGSVKHNLIQFALAWYHVPSWFAETAFHYYENLVVFISTHDWSTAPFRYGVGVYQGCVIACLFFILVYQLVIDYVKAHGVMPYTFKSTLPDQSILQQGFVDDHNCSPHGAQFNLNLICSILSWTRCLFLKPGKCYSFALGDRRSHGGASYGAFDPGLTISGKAVEFFADELHKYLGRLFSTDITNKGAYKLTLEFFSSALSRIDDAPITGPSKAWIYQFYVLAVLSWPFLIYPFSVTNIFKDFEALATRFLKKWYGLAKSANPSILFLPKSRNGLGITSPVEKFKTLQVCAFHQLVNSKDPLITSLAKSSNERDSLSKSNKWSPATALTSAESSLNFNLSFNGQVGSTGLGNMSNRKSSSNPKAKRSAIAAIIRDSEAEARVAALRDKPLSGNFLKWDKLTHPVTNWNQQILSMSEAELSFILNGQAQSLPDPSNLRRWGCNALARCLLCGKPAATCKHILNGCSVALRQSRYLWRHNNVLKVLAPDLRGRIARENHTPPTPMNFINFVPAGVAPLHRLRASGIPPLLRGAMDWQLEIDLDNTLVFPPIIATTNLRPDIVIWSRSTKTVIWGELTCPLEELILDAYVRKKSRYLALEVECRVRGWTVHAFPFEVGSLGFVGNSSRHFLIALGFSGSQLKFMTQRMSSAARRSSFHIWHCRRNKQWIGPPLGSGPVTKGSPKEHPPPSPLFPLSLPSSLPPLPPLPPPPFPPPFHLLPPQVRARILSNKEAAPRRRELCKRVNALDRRPSGFPVPDTAAVHFGLPHELAGENGIQLDSLGLPLVGNFTERLTSSDIPQDTACISSLSLRDLSIDEINHLWFKDINSRTPDQAGMKSPSGVRTNSLPDRDKAVSQSVSQLVSHTGRQPDSQATSQSASHSVDRLHELSILMSM